MDRTDLFPRAVRDAYTYVAGWSDLDGDDHPDLVMANDYPVVVPSLSAFNRTGGFVVADGLGLTLKRAGMGCWRSGTSTATCRRLPDAGVGRGVALTSVGGYGSTPAMRWGSGSPRATKHGIGWGAESANLDNDGDLDGIVAFGHLDAVGDYTPSGGTTVNAAEQRLAVYVQEDGRFTEQAGALGLDDPGVWRGFVVADLNGDGWPDLAKRNLRGRSSSSCRGVGRRGG